MSGAKVVAVTGANGYVGSIIAAALKDEAEVLSLSRAPRGDNQIAFEFGGDMDLLARRLREHGVTHLIHAAWDMRTSTAKEAERICVAGSRAVLAAARRAGVEKLIFISSVSAFRSARSTYGRSKLEVEQAFRDAGGLVLRLGLIHGAHAGGAFGAMKRIATTSPIIPLIGDGKAPQFLLAEDDLKDIIVRAVRGEFDDEASVMTLAHPEPLAFRDILFRLAEEAGCRPIFLPIPWRILYCVLLSQEKLGFKPRARSDSILSFVYQDPAPDFVPMRRHGISPKPFSCSASGACAESAGSERAANRKAWPPG
ncbi:NAD-dependent epimerase/dehydratase family protein [Methylocystis heyeri]|uniref:NAD-dependent epimerase/dehydratase family protein n=1 Tax=Methylocystis heyeri TaxID=391905 RepID=A0A6B8KJD0_9HYPH|nr:NAD-dependent epimerase/dehydratase family protein [Methylocystis heyeri]QGM46673.1 NAD-dependent epimerase/dehydratase family protein [Methylocystis heyeri]